MRLARSWSRPDLIAVHGFYGMGNVGDEAILGATLQAIRKVGATPAVLAWESSAVARDWEVSVADARGRGRDVLRLLSGSRALLLGGGGLLKDFGNTSESLERWLRWLDVAARNGIGTMTWSVGVEKLVHPRSVQRLVETLSRLDVVTVRDDDSADRLRRLGLQRDVVVTADPVPAFVRPLRSVRDARTSGSRTRIAVAPRHWFATGHSTEDAEVFDRFVSNLAKALDTLAHQADAEVVFVPFRSVPHDDDREASREIADRMSWPDVTVLDDPAPTIDATVSRLAHADVVVAMRLHAAVIGTTLGVPTVGLSYAPKVESYMTEIGLGDYCADLKNMSTGWLVERTRRALEEKEELAKSLILRTDELADRFEMNVRLLREIAS